MSHKNVRRILYVISVESDFVGQTKAFSPVLDFGHQCFEVKSSSLGCRYKNRRAV